MAGTGDIYDEFGDWHPGDDRDPDLKFEGKSQPDSSSANWAPYSMAQDWEKEAVILPDHLQIAYGKYLESRSGKEEFKADFESAELAASKLPSKTAVSKGLPTLPDLTGSRNHRPEGLLHRKSSAAIEQSSDDHVRQSVQRVEGLADFKGLDPLLDTESRRRLHRRHTNRDYRQRKSSAEESSVVALDPEIHARQNVEGLEVQTDFENLDALLNPESYFRSLDELEMDMIERCDIRSGFAQDINQTGDMVCDSHTLTVHHRTLLLAIDLLQENGDCQDHVIVFIEDKDREGIIKAVELKVSDIKDFANYVFSTNGSNNFDRYRQARTALLTPFGLNLDEYLFRPVVFRVLLLMGLVSYSGSHCSPLDLSIWDRPIDTVTFPVGLRDLSNPLKHETPLFFRRRHLTCLDSFNGSPVWVFGTSRASDPASLSITVKQFAELWGPAFAIPRNGDFSTLIALKVDGGVIHRVDATESSSGEIPMHFVPTTSMRKEILRGGRCSDHMLYSSTNGETIPDHLQAFPSTAQLIIGHPTPSTTTTTNTVVEQLPSHKVVVSGSESQLLTINEACKLDVHRFGRDNVHKLQPLGTRAEFYVPDEFQAGFNAGQYVTVGYQRVWRRRPGITYKSTLLQYCSNPNAKISPILSLQVGLQFSICTGNARRISLWDALVLSHPDQADELKAMRDAGDSLSLASYIHQLAQTGMDERGHLQLFWPFKPGIPDVFELDVGAPSWTQMLKETRSSTCFALMSSQCLTYRGRDRFAGLQDLRVTRLCNGSASSYAGGLLQTAINLHPWYGASLPLPCGIRLKLSEGCLMMRASALAAYMKNSPLSRINDVVVSARGGRPAQVHAELLDPGRASNRVVPLCIMDDP